MASLLAITDIGSGWVGCGPRAWACLYNCHIQSCGSWPPRLNQSSIWAVESTWSSCLPFGNTVDRLALGDLAPLTVDRGIDRLIQRRDQQRRHVRAARAARVARLTFLNAPLHQPLRVDQSEPPFRIVGRGEAGPWRPLRCGAAAGAGNMAVAADNALDLIRRHARLVHRVTAGQDVNGLQKLLGCCNYRVRPSLVRLIIRLRARSTVARKTRADVELLLRDRGFDIVSVTPRRRRRVSPLRPRPPSGTAK